jgi:hypothetical protein
MTYFSDIITGIYLEPEMRRLLLECPHPYSERCALAALATLRENLTRERENLGRGRENVFRRRENLAPKRENKRVSLLEERRRREM